MVNCLLRSSRKRVKRKKASMGGEYPLFAMCLCAFFPHPHRIKRFWMRFFCLVEPIDSFARWKSRRTISLVLFIHIFYPRCGSPFFRFYVLDFNLPTIIYSNVLHSRYFSPFFFSPSLVRRFYIFRMPFHWRTVLFSGIFLSPIETMLSSVSIVAIASLHASRATAREWVGFDVFNLLKPNEMKFLDNII